MKFLKNTKEPNRKKKAEKYESVKIGDRMNIDVIECRYDERGFAPIDFDTIIREPDFL